MRARLTTTGLLLAAALALPAAAGSHLNAPPNLIRNGGFEQPAVGAAGYTLYAVGNVVDPNGVFGTTSTVNVIVNGHKLLAASNKSGGTTQTWKTFTLTVKATKAVSTVGFQNGDGGSDNSNGLDAVSLSKR